MSRWILEFSIRLVQSVRLSLRIHCRIKLYSSCWNPMFILASFLTFLLWPCLFCRFLILYWLWFSVQICCFYCYRLYWRLLWDLFILERIRARNLIIQTDSLEWLVSRRWHRSIRTLIHKDCIFVPCVLCCWSRVTFIGASLCSLRIRDSQTFLHGLLLSCDLVHLIHIDILFIDPLWCF